MPRLDWIGRKAVENHHRQVPFHLLKEVPELSVGDPGSGNLLVEGDNLLALKALLPYYAGQVKCIYIDPPYNTGNEKWVYNDNVNSPEMLEWLGKAVGKEAEDLSRHDKWLCMMYTRLQLLRTFLTEDGIVFVSIDNNEVHHLRVLFDDVFGTRNFVSCIANINNPKGRSDDKHIPTAHEYILVYKKSSDPALYGWKPEEKILKRYNKMDTDGKPYREIDLRKTGDEDRKEDREDMFYYFYFNKKTADLIVAKEKKTLRDYIEIVPLKEDGSLGRWRWGIETATNNKGVLLPKLMPVRKVWTVFEKDYLDKDERVKPTSAWTKKQFNSERGTEQFLELGFSKEEFPKPKPTGLVKHILEFATNKSDLILDSFAGSGTTAQAVMQLNKEDGGNRRCILVEMDSNICRNVTAERLRRISQGYKNTKGEDVAGLGGGFRFATLGEPLFDERGNIRKTVKFPDLARHVYFTETGEPLPNDSLRKTTQNKWITAFAGMTAGGKPGISEKAYSPLIGICNGIAVYLLYNGILKDKTPDGGNVLTTAVLSHLPKHDGPKVIYGTACRIGPERLRRENITFKQLPYKIKTM